MQRYVRQFASSKGLNVNDEEHENVTSYSTRVERVHKHVGSNKWTLTLRRLVEIPYFSGKLRADWWTEKFDAVVVATNSESDSPWVPPIPRLVDWANAYPEAIYHVRNYRRPESFLGKASMLFCPITPRLGWADCQSRKYLSLVAFCLLQESQPISPLMHRPCL